jgi:hypothetical protein
MIGFALSLSVGKGMCWMETQETTREQLMTKIETLQMEIEKLEEMAANPGGGRVGYC